MFQLGYQENTAELSLHIPAVEDKKTIIIRTLQTVTQRIKGNKKLATETITVICLYT